MTSYPKYQYSIFLNGSKDEQLVIRTDSWDDFISAKKNVNKIIKKVKTSAESTNSTVCTECNAPMLYKEGVSKAGKAWKGYFCTKCKNVSWTR